MIDAPYARLKQMLEVYRRELQRNLNVRLRDLVANNGHNGEVVGALDAAEASDWDLQQDIGIALTEMIAEVLSRVDEALARLASGVYGSCVECDFEISQTRLTALPFALRCRECEEVREIGERQSPQFSAGRSIATAVRHGFSTLACVFERPPQARDADIRRMSHFKDIAQRGTCSKTPMPVQDSWP